MPSAFITGLAGPTLESAERWFLRAARPAGFILFARNVVDPAQVRRLVADARAAIGSDETLVLIDQEGGRVQRLRPPHWRALPPGRAFKRLDGLNRLTPKEAAHIVSHLTAADLAALGINCNCTPVLDVPVPGSHDIIGDRAYDTTPAAVAELGRAVMEGCIAGGVVPVIKHIPGHGRAKADSHLELPVVDAALADLEATDFVPFRDLADAPAAMTAHVVYTAIDGRHPASTSPRVHRDIIRGHIGFDGLLMSDDLSMNALDGPMHARAAAVIAAGSDLALHCNGNLAEMAAVASAVPSLEGAALARFRRALAVTHRQAPLDIPAAEACLAQVLALSA
jgi:beta-N-acetylhexosaminidase